jgi:sulfide:quinone oxidoreductase
MFASMHCRVAVVGAGPAGHSVSSQLMKSNEFNHGDITIFDPSKEHHYQPGYTMVGGGVIGNVAEARAQEE